MNIIGWLLAAFGKVASALGALFIKAGKSTSQFLINPIEIYLLLILNLFFILSIYLYILVYGSLSFILFSLFYNFFLRLIMFLLCISIYYSFYVLILLFFIYLRVWGYFVGPCMVESTS